MQRVRFPHWVLGPRVQRLGPSSSSTSSGSLANKDSRDSKLRVCKAWLVQVRGGGKSRYSTDHFSLSRMRTMTGTWVCIHGCVFSSGYPFWVASKGSQKGNHSFLGALKTINTPTLFRQKPMMVTQCLCAQVRPRRRRRRGEPCSARRSVANR